MRIIFTKRLIILCIVGLARVNSSAQSEAVYAVRNLVTNNLLVIESLTKDDSNSVYLIGYDETTQQEFLVKLDENGSMVWQKEIQSDIQFYYTQIEFHENELYILGTTPPFAVQYELIKADMNGNTIWSKRLTPVGEAIESTASMDIGSNSEIIISGSGGDATSSTFIVSIFSLNTDGSTNWIRNFNSDSTAVKNLNFDIEATSNGSIIGCNQLADGEMSFYSLSSSGHVKWVKRILATTGIGGRVESILEIDSNKFLVCGNTASIGFYGFIDSSANFLDFRFVNESNAIQTAILLNNGNILLKGFNYFGNINFYLTIDQSGNLIESYIAPWLTGGGFDRSGYFMNYNRILETSNNYRYLGSGYTIQKTTDYNSFQCLNFSTTVLSFTGEDPNTAPTSNYYALYPGGIVNEDTIIQLQSCNLVLQDWCTISDVHENFSSTVRVYPTLLNNNEPIFIEHEMTGDIQYQIMDINGKMVEQNVLSNSSLMINGLSAGMYVLQLTNNGNAIYHSKFVVN